MVGGTNTPGWSVNALCSLVGGIAPSPVVDTGPILVETAFSLDPSPGAVEYGFTLL